MSRNRPFVGSNGIARLRPRTAAALSAVAGLLMLTGVSQAAPKPSCTPGRDGAWTVFGTPHFTSGPAAMTGYAVSPRGRSVYATNSRVVLRTDDTGCTWKTVYTAATSSTGTDQIARVVTLPSLSTNTSAGVSQASVPATGKDTVLVVVTSGADAVPAAPLTTVVSSTDSGGSWSAKGRALPGQLVDASATAAGGKPTFYALLRQTPVDDVTTGVTAQSAVVVARSDDAGATWALGTQTANGPSLAIPSNGTTAGAPPPHFTEVVADPTKPLHAWFAEPQGLYETTDGGSTTTLASQATSLGTEHLAISLNSKKQVQVAFSFIGSTRPSVGYSRPDPKKFNTDLYAVAQIPAKVTSLVSGWRSGEFVAATPAGVALHRPPTGFEQPLTDVSPRKATLTDLAAVKNGAELTVYGRTGNTLLVRQMPRPKPPVKLVGPDGRPITGPTFKPPVDDGPTRPGEPKIDPDHVRITLPVGSQREFPYTLSLPGSRKVDVFMLVDTSGSMTNKIEATKKGLAAIVDGFGKAHVDAWFGLGQYRTYTQSPPYERIQDVGPYTPRFKAALQGLNASGGGSDKTQLDALYQVATGQGMSTSTTFIAAGQQAHWRPDALHVVLHLTDESFVDGPPHPSRDLVAAALRRVHALQIGVGFQCAADDRPCQLQALGAGQTTDPMEGLVDMARRTGAFAPPEGADCDGDGQPDLFPGQPLACPIPPGKAGDNAVMATAIVNTVLATPDFAPVSVTWQAKQPVVADVTPRVAPGVNLRFPAALTFHVTYACPAQLPAGSGYLATLTARVRSLVVAVAKAQIDCVAPPGPLVHIPPAVAAGIITVPNPPPNPVNQPNPQSQPQQQPQTQSQAQAQAGAAYQEQEQAELAFAYMNPGNAPQTESETTTYLFSAYIPSPQHDPTLAWLGAGAAGMSTAALGVLWTRRRQIRTAEVRRSPR